ncbi:hypothetical protein B4147_5896 [Bacillus wiedmannii]|uniref:Uncharacterized protein n=1 Tax=Bacillus wiedmannii TaxID=1890302 RepID=A0A0G8C5M1_9BACI|nr:hypothetical protein B4147_5896 [Bacillus wiedmannii]
MVSLITKSITKTTKTIFGIKKVLYYGWEHERMPIGGGKDSGK